MTGWAPSSRLSLLSGHRVRWPALTLRSSDDLELGVPDGLDLDLAAPVRRDRPKREPTRREAQSKPTVDVCDERDLGNRYRTGRDRNDRAWRRPTVGADDTSTVLLQFSHIESTTSGLLHIVLDPFGQPGHDLGYEPW